MRLGLFLASLIGPMGAAHVSSAADASWVAVSESKHLSAWCGSNSAAFDVVIKGNTLTFTSRSTTKLSETVDVTALQPDGSGKLVGKDWKDREFYVTFEPGAGPRPFYVTTFIGHCRYLFTPKT